MDVCRIGLLPWKRLFGQLLTGSDVLVTKEAEATQKMRRCCLSATP